MGCSPRHSAVGVGQAKITLDGRRGEPGSALVSPAHIPALADGRHPLTLDFFFFNCIIKEFTWGSHLEILH